MLLTLMFVCAVVAVILIAFGTFGELRDLWAHPDHKAEEDHSHYVGSRRDTEGPRKAA